MYACGLVHSKRLTTPVMVVGFDMSYMPVPWCASMGSAANTDPDPSGRNVRRDFIVKPPALLLPEVYQVLFVLVAHEFQQLGVGSQLHHFGDGPRLGVRLRVVDGDSDFQVAHVAAAETLGDMQGFPGRLGGLG